MDAQCAERVYGAWGVGRPCKHKAKVERNGKSYCTQHDPERVARIHAEKIAAWQENWAQAQEGQGLKAHKLATWDDLLEAAQALLACRWVSETTSDTVDRLRAAIDKAQGP